MKELKIIRDDPSFSEGQYKREEDAFNHEAFAQTVFRVIKDNDPPLTIGLFGGWGLGKTSIINLLKSKCAGQPGTYGFVLFNAWAYSGDSLRRQLLISLANGLISNESARVVEIERLRKLNYAQALEEEPGYSIKDLWDRSRDTGFLTAMKSEILRAFENVKFAQQGIVGMCISAVLFIAAFIMILYGGIKSEMEIQRWGFLSLFLGAANFLMPKTENIFVLKRREVFDARLIFPEQFEEEYNNLISKYAVDADKVVVVIDDLDRCDAETIKSVLVTLKNFMGKGKTVFIVPMDDSSVVRMFRGENTNFGYEQLRKYFSVSIRIPPVHQDDLLDFARRVSSEYEIPPNIAYIAALGNCRDARKMKHFLNLYKLKYALAEERATNNFLGRIDLEKITEQLAKIAVLEYQFPEFYRFVSIYPETIELFTEAARDNKKPELEKIPLKEISEELEKIGKPTIEDLWLSQTGLKQFLSATYDTPLEEFDVISKLKTTNQEFALTEFGVEVRNAITKGTQIDVEKFLSPQYMKEHGQSIVDVIGRYFDPDLPLPGRIAVRISLDILRRRGLDNVHQNELFRKTASMLTHIKMGLKLNGSEAPVLLDGIEVLGQKVQLELGKKLVEDIFSSESFDQDYWRVLHHPVLKKVLTFNKQLSSSITSATEKWFAGLSDLAQKQQFVLGIAQVPFSAQERNDIGLAFPSTALLSTLVASLMTDMPELNDLIVEVVLDEKNPEKFDDDKIGLGKKMASVIAKNIPSGPDNPALMLACSAICKMPSWLDVESAVNTASLIVSHFAKHPAETSIHLLLDTLAVCYASLGASAPKKNEIKEGYLKLTEELNSHQIETYVNYFNSGDLNQMEETKTLVSSILTRRWLNVNEDMSSPTDTIVDDARLCRKFVDVIGKEEYDALHLKLLQLEDVAALRTWEQFIIEDIVQLNVDRAMMALDRCLANLQDASKDGETRIFYGDLLMHLLARYDVTLGMPFFKKLYGLLTSADSVNVQFVVTNSSMLLDRYGNEIPQSDTGEHIGELLKRESLAPYRGAIQVFLGFADYVAGEIWESAVTRAISEIPNESLDVSHRRELLDLLGGTRDVEGLAANLSEVLYSYKEGGAVDELKGKAWEVYDSLTRLGRIPHYSPPPAPILANEPDNQ